MTGLRLHQPHTTTATSVQPTLKFPAQAVRALPEWAHRESSGLRLRTPEEVEGGASTSDLVANVGATIARMQARINELRRDAREAILFPLQSGVEGSSYDRPRAA